MPKRKNTFPLLLKYLKLNVMTWMEYRSDFVIGILAIFMTNIISILFFWVIFGYIVEFNGWSFFQLLFLYGFLAFSFGIWHAFLAGVSPWRMERYVREGSFDRLLLQPVNPLTYLLVSHLDDDGFGDLIAGLLILFYSSSKLGLVWTPQLLGILSILVFGSVLIIFSIVLLFTSITFFVVRSQVIADLFWHLTRFVEYPLEIYSPAIMFFLTFVLPLGFISYYPSQLFLGKGLYMQYAYFTPLIGVVLLIIAYSFWKIGIKNYSSTGS